MLGRYREPVRAWTAPVGRALFRLHLRPNHLTIIGFGVSVLAAAAFATGRIRVAGLLLIVAGLCDFFDGALARVSGQVTAFGAFLDSVIDRYSDLVVMCGIVALFLRTPHARGAAVAMAGLIGSTMVSYTRARAESVGIACTVGMMERPERLICLIAGAILNLLEPALWILAVFSNLTALQRIIATRRAARDVPLLRGLALGGALLLAAGAARAEPPPRRPSVTPEVERAWAAAVEAYQAGEAGPLVQALDTEVARESPIGDYLRYVLADALAREGDLPAARAAATSVADRWRAGRLAPRALLLAATLAARAGDDAGAQTLLARLVGAYPDAPEAAEALYLLGLGAEARGQPDLAAQTYRELQLLLPASDYADGAADRLAALAAAGQTVPPFTAAERLARARRLLRGGQPSQAIEEADHVVADAREDDLAVRALRVAADAARRLGRWEFAARALGLVAARGPAERKPALQLERGRLLARAGQRKEALALLDEAAATGGPAEASDALYQRARLLEDADKPKAAIDAYRAVVAKYATREVGAASRWRLGWLAWLDGDVRGADEQWTRLAAPGGDRAYRMAALYWTGRASERLGEREAAQGRYRQILVEAPRTYYGVLAEARATAPVAASGDGDVAMPPEPLRAVVGDAEFARVELLRRVGLVEFALDELAELTARAGGDPARLYGLSSVYVQEERYHLAVRVFRRYLAGLAATGDPGLPRAFWETFYPLAWREELTAAARGEGLDPYLVAAVVREESSYHPGAVSRAGARGLMQLMPGTAAPIARATGLKFRNGRVLDEPGPNLRLGSRFLAALVREFRDPRLALAAYNAGPTRVRQWWSARRSDDLEVFVEQIPYDETRHYVKRVLLSWDEYRRLYGGR